MLAQALMSIQAVKAVAMGAGFVAGGTPGSAFHDEILFDDAAGLHRAGGPHPPVQPHLRPGAGRPPGGAR